MSTSIIYPNLTGAQSSFAVPFDYLSKEHVKVTLDGVATTSFSFTSTSVIQMDTAPTGELRIYRDTPSEVSLVTWTDGSILIDDDLNLGNLQTLFVTEELRDISFPVDASGNWDAEDKRILNVGDPVDDGDAVNKGWFTGTFLPTIQNLVDTALGHSNSANTHRAAAATHEANADSAASAASGSASAASSSASAASSSATAAQSAQTGAETAQTAAEGFRDEAEVFKDQAASAAAGGLPARLQEDTTDNLISDLNLAVTSGFWGFHKQQCKLSYNLLRFSPSD